MEAPLAAAATASWYGPGMWGNRTACGQTLTSDLRGVAHRTLPCGTPVTLRYGSGTLTVAVVDRGPFIYSREFDLTYATRVALGCPDICYLSWLR
jgi:rare lipoprotein A